MSAPVSGPTLTIYTTEVTYMLARRKKFDGRGTTPVPQGVMSKQNMEQSNDSGMCLCMSCMCGAMREGMCEKSNQFCRASDGLVGEIKNVIENVML